MRTYESQIAFLKNKINNKIYQFKITENIANQAAADGYDEIDKADVALHIFKEFLHFVTNSLFYNYQTFRTFEEEFYSKGFRKARVYQRIQPILQKLFKKAIEKEVFTLKSLRKCNLNIPDEANADEFLQFCLRLQENV